MYAKPPLQNPLFRLIENETARFACTRGSFCGNEPLVQARTPPAHSITSCHNFLALSSFSSTFGISSKIPGEIQNHGAAVTTAAIGIVIAYARGFLEAQFTEFSCSRLP